MVRPRPADVLMEFILELDEAVVPRAIELDTSKDAANDKGADLSTRGGNLDALHVVRLDGAEVGNALLPAEDVEGERETLEAQKVVPAYVVFLISVAWTGGTWTRDEAGQLCTGARRFPDAFWSLLGSAFEGM